jgi:AraC family transcriptional regulator of adaptative response/methylated-DNA-[protein]-cysteine methyltransferase
MSDNLNILSLTHFETTLGSMVAGAVDAGICLLEFSDRKMLPTELKDLTRRLKATPVEVDHPHFKVLNRQLNEYFEGILKEFTMPLVMPGTDFQQKVWRELLTIPYGTTRTYFQQAIALGDAAAIRAVAHANGMNRIAILIPCHRVIGSNGQLTGYGGGLWRKRWLLELERGASPTLF